MVGDPEPFGDIAVPENDYVETWVIQIITILLYSIVLMFAAINTWKYVISKKRWQVVPIALFYLFATLLAIVRIIMHVIELVDMYYLNKKIQVCNQVADAFSVCIGISQLHVIMELIFTIQLFRAECFGEDSDIVNESRSRHEFKVKVLNIITFLMVLANLVFVFLCLFDKVTRKYDGIIFVAEIMFIGITMLVLTCYLINVINKTFGQEFVDEKHTLKVALFVFLSTYLVRFIIKILLEYTIRDYFIQMWDEEPFLIFSLYTLAQLLYDFLPLILIFRQHRIHYSQNTRLSSQRDSSIPLTRPTLRPSSAYSKDTSMKSPSMASSDDNRDKLTLTMVINTHREREGTLLFGRITRLGAIHKNKDVEDDDLDLGQHYRHLTKIDPKMFGSDDRIELKHSAFSQDDVDKGVIPALPG